MRVMFALILILSTAAPAQADCVLDGRRVPSGTRVGNLECSGSTWIRIKNKYPDDARKPHLNRDTTNMPSQKGFLI